MDEVGHDQEVAGKPHLPDNVEFVLEALAIGPRGGLLLCRRHLGPGDLALQALFQSGLGLGPQLFGFVAADFRRIGRQDRIDRLRAVGAAPGDHQGVVDRLGQVREQRPHFLGRLEAVVRRQAAPVGLAEVGPVGDAKQRVVGLVHAHIGEVDVVGGDQRKVVAVGEIDQSVLDLRLFGQIVAHDLDIEASFEHPLVHLEGGFRLRHSALAEQTPDGACRTADERDQAARVAVEVLEGDLRAGGGVAFQIGQAHQLGEIAVAGLALHQQKDLVR